VVVFRLTTVVPVSLGAVLLVSAGASSAGAADRPQVFVMLQNVARAPAGLLERAQTEVSRLFRHIDVEIVWTLRIPPDHRNMRTLVLTDFEPNPSAAPPLVLGFTQSAPDVRGTRAYVFLPRVLRMAQKFNVMSDKLLAAAIAHELGHTLLPDASHAASGIMRAPWDNFDLRAVSGGWLQFSEDSARLIRRTASDGSR
jgi:hypothetical protein